MITHLVRRGIAGWGMCRDCNVSSNQEGKRAALTMLSQDCLSHRLELSCMGRWYQPKVDPDLVHTRLLCSGVCWEEVDVISSLSRRKW